MSLALPTRGASVAGSRLVARSRPRRGVARPAASDGSSSSSRSEPRDRDDVPGRHWSRKLDGAGRETTRDDLRYMSSDGANRANVDPTLTQRVMSVKRDRDNVTLVGDERLVLPFLADALGRSEEDARAAVEQLCALLPPMRARIGVVGVPALASMCADLPGLSRRLLRLRDLFPSCDVGAMACASPHLLTGDLDGFAANLTRLRDIFPEAGMDGKPDVDRMVQAVPQLLDADFAAAAVAAVATSTGTSRERAATAVHRDPRLALAVESAAVRSAYSASFDQGNVVRNKVVRRKDPGEAYYRNSAPPPTPAKKRAPESDE
jgi:hypothetical protein